MSIWHAVRGERDFGLNPEYSPVFLAVGTRRVRRRGCGGILKTAQEHTLGESAAFTSSCADWIDHLNVFLTTFVKISFCKPKVKLV